MKKFAFALVVLVASFSLALAQTAAKNSFEPIKEEVFTKALEGRVEAPKSNPFTEQLSASRETQGMVELIIVVWEKSGRHQLSIFNNALVKVVTLDANGKPLALAETRYAKLSIGAPTYHGMFLPLHKLLEAKGAEVTFLPEGSTTFVTWKPIFKPQS